MSHIILPERLDRRVIYESDWVSLYADKVKMPDGRIISTYDIVDTIQKIFHIAFGVGSACGQN